MTYWYSIGQTWYNVGNFAQVNPELFNLGTADILIIVWWWLGMFCVLWVVYHQMPIAPPKVVTTFDIFHVSSRSSDVTLGSSANKNAPYIKIKNFKTVTVAEN